MKRISIGLYSVLLAAALLSPACRKESGVAAGGEESSVTLSVGADVVLSYSKAASLPEISSRKVNSLQVFVFRSGKFANRSDIERGSVVEMALRTNASGVDYEFIAVANNYSEEKKGWKVDFNDCDTPEAIYAKVMDLSDYSPDDLPMVGANTSIVTLGTSTVGVKVRRMVAKVELQNIVIDYSNDLLKTRDLTLRSIYVINAVASQTLDGRVPDGAAPVYYNDGAYSEGAWSACLSDVKSTPVTLNAGATRTPYNYSVPHTFFVFGNATARRSRLVIETLYDGRDVLYYAADLGDVEPGKAYVVTRAVIRGMGAADPAENPDRTTLSVSVEVLPWEDGFVKEVEL